MTTLGIDFGDSYISIARKDVGLVLKETSLIAATKNQDRYEVKALGQEAKLMMGKTDERTVIFSPISEGEIKSFDYAKILATYCIEKVIGKISIFNKFKVIVSVPTGISDDEKLKYIDLFTKCGSKEVICVPKIICSSIGTGINVNANNAHLVVDIGGGTMDCGVINLNSIICGSTLCLGGRDMDSTIIDYIKEKYNVNIGALTAQKLKEDIGSLYVSDTACTEICGIDCKTLSPVNIKVNAHDIFIAVSPFVNEYIKVIKTTINTLTPEISSDIKRNGIIICGGYSRTVGIDKYIRKEVELPVIVADSAENACILGLNKLISCDDDLDKILLDT